MLFILFDIEAAFLFPWAVTFRDFTADKMFVLGEMGVFLGILVLGFVYVWKRTVSVPGFSAKTGFVNRTSV